MRRRKTHPLDWWAHERVFKWQICQRTVEKTSRLTSPSPTQRIETKRHRVCLEVPDNVIPKEDEEEDGDRDDDDEQYGKRPRPSLLPPRYASPDCKRPKGKRVEENVRSPRFELVRLITLLI